MPAAVVISASFDEGVGCHVHGAATRCGFDELDGCPDRCDEVVLFGGAPGQRQRRRMVADAIVEQCSREVGEGQPEPFPAFHDIADVGVDERRQLCLIATECQEAGESQGGEFVTSGQYDGLCLVESMFCGGQVARL